METAATPTLRSELRRGVNLYNLGVGFFSALVLAVVVYALTAADIVPVLLGSGPVLQSLVAGTSLFILITALHVAAHAYFGWRFERGVAALSAGNSAKALRLLAIAERRGMDHYDLNGSVRRLLATLQQEAPPGSAAPH